MGIANEYEKRSQGTALHTSWVMRKELTAAELTNVSRQVNALASIELGRRPHANTEVPGGNEEAFSKASGSNSDVDRDRGTSFFILYFDLIGLVSRRLKLSNGDVRYGGSRAEEVWTLLPSHLANGQGNVMEALKMGLTGMVFSTIAIAVGAVMYWAVTNTQGHGFRLSTVGVILMIVGAIGLAVSATIFGTSRRTTGRRGHTYDREVTDSRGGVAAVHEEVH